MTITLDGTTGITSPNDTTGNQSYTGTLTGGTGVVNLGSGQFYKDASGNVGIGTSSPAGYKLNVNGTSNFSGTINLTSASSVQWNGGDAAIVNSGTNLLFKTYNGSSLAEQARIDSSGNVGIGTASPQAKLHANSANNATSLLLTPNSGSSAGDYTQLGFGNSASSGTVYGGIRTAFVSPAATSAVSMQFWTDVGGSAYAERMRIDSSGNVCIGTTSGSGARMDVVAADEVVSFNRDAATDGVIQRWRKAGSTVGYISTNTYSLPSDERVKKNIVNIGYGLDFVNSLRPVQYNTIFQDDANESQKNFGLIAQEVEQALESIGKSINDVTFLEKFVPENDKASRYGLGYQNLVPVLIKAIQEQQALIESLTTRLTVLENK